MMTPYLGFCSLREAREPTLNLTALSWRPLDEYSSAQVTSLFGAQYKNDSRLDEFYERRTLLNQLQSVPSRACDTTSVSAGPCKRAN